VKRVRVQHRKTLAITATPDSFAVVSAFPVKNPPQPSAETCVVHVPFNFLVGEMLLGAGAYWLGRSDRAGMRTLSAADGTVPGIQVQAIQVPQENSAPNRLLFYCRRDRYFLAQVLADAA
jgi:hypothetical protein